MTWSNSIRAAVSGLTSLYPQVFSPTNGEDLGQANFADGLGRLSTAIDSLRSVGWHSDEITIAGDLHGAYETVGSNIWDRAEIATSGGGTTLWPVWDSSSTSNSNGRLIIQMPHAVVNDLYISGFTVISQHVGTVHASVPANPFVGEMYRTNAVGTALVRVDPAANMASVGVYEALTAYRLTYVPGSRPRCNLTEVYSLALRPEHSADAQTGRRVRGVLFHFSKDA